MKLPRPKQTERADRPSASGRERWGSCAGHHKLSLAVGVGEETDAMRRGTLIHSVLAGETARNKLTEGESEIYDLLLLNDSEVSSNYIRQDFELLDTVTELRYWYDGKLFSGQPDKVCLYRLPDSEKLVIVITDYKTGASGPSVAAAGNHQLEALVALLDCHVAMDDELAAAEIEWHTWIVHQEGASQAIYSQECVAEIRKRIGYELDEMAVEDPPRMVGPHCTWCNAKWICPQAVAVTSGIGGGAGAVIVQSKEGELTTGKHIGMLLDRANLAEKVIADIRKAAKDMLEADAESVPGWSLSKAGTRRTVVNAEALADKLKAMGADVKPKITLSVAEVEKAIRKCAEPSRFDGLINGYIKATSISPSLRRQKGGD